MRLLSRIDGSVLVAADHQSMPPKQNLRRKQRHGGSTRRAWSLQGV